MLVEHDFALEDPVHRALGGDDPQPLDLLLGEVVGELQHHGEARRAPAVGGGELGLDLHSADVPALVGGVHLHRHRRTGGEAGGQELQRVRPLVGAPEILPLVRRELMVTDADGLLERAGAGADG